MKARWIWLQRSGWSTGWAADVALAKRLIPCLDVDGGRVVKGVRFEGLRDAGNPLEIARRYDEQGADELAFLDITASHQERDTLLHLVEAVAAQVFIPLTVGGGVRDCADVRRLLNAGADKISINSAAVARPAFIAEAADHFGSQCIVVAIDARRVPGTEAAPRWEIHTHGGRRPTGLDALDWAERMARDGAGELLVTSMDRDGTGLGFDNELNRAIAARVEVPIIASGGVGKLDHLRDGLLVGHADAVLAASIFHFGTHTIPEAKAFMAAAGLEMRLDPVQVEP